MKSWPNSKLQRQTAFAANKKQSLIARVAFVALLAAFVNFCWRELKSETEKKNCYCFSRGANCLQLQVQKSRQLRESKVEPICNQKRNKSDAQNRRASQELSRKVFLHSGEPFFARVLFSLDESRCKKARLRCSNGQKSGLCEAESRD